MSFLKKIGSLFSSLEDKRNFWFYVQCDFCKEVIKGRIDMQNDLSLKFSEAKDEPVFYCRKVMVGNKRCFRPIEVEFYFDSRRKLVDRQIHGGKFVEFDDHHQDSG
jgi:hypothetical protein